MRRPSYRSAGVLALLSLTLGFLALLPASLQVTAGDSAPSGTRISPAALAAAGSAYSIRLQVIQLMNDDGSLPADITPAQVQTLVNQANLIYAPAGIVFKFTPNATGPDWATLNSTLINGISLDPNDPQRAARGAAAMREASMYPGKMVVFFYHGALRTPAGQGWSGHDLNYVMMPGFVTEWYCNHVPLNHLAHEMGHQLFLPHTFQFFWTLAEASTYLTNHLNNPLCMDGDGFDDTLPDPFVEEKKCEFPTTLTVGGVQFALPYDNVMTYWDSAMRTLSLKQIDRARLAAVSRDFVPDPLAVVSWGPGRLDVFALGADKAIWHKALDGATWSDWHSLGGPIQFISSPTAVSWGPYRLDIFAIGEDRALWHQWWDGSWGTWHSLGGQWSLAPSVASWGPNRLDVFALGDDRALWHLAWSGGEGGKRAGWGQWESLGNTLASPPQAISWGPNRLDVFALALDRSVLHIAWAGSWSGWESQGGTFILPPTVVSWGENRLDLFGVDQSMTLVHKEWTGKYWRGTWDNLGGYLVSTVEAVARGPQQLSIFGVGLDQKLYCLEGDGQATWGTWWPLDGQITTPPHAVVWGPDRLDVFAMSRDGTFLHRFREPPLPHMIEPWRLWESIGAP